METRRTILAGLRIKPGKYHFTAGKTRHLLQAQSAISLSLSRAHQQADGGETYFIMKTYGRVILRKAEIVLSRQVSSTMVALSGIHELFLGNEGLVEVSVQRTKNTAAAIESTSEF